MATSVRDDTGEELTIAAYTAFEQARRAEIDDAIDRIFFAASSVQSFRDAGERAAFRWLWLGRYLVEEPEEAIVALLNGTVCGYLVGSLADPAPRPEFRELAYFRDFAAATARFPAHLHINLDEGVRGRGIGARLVEHFAAHAAARGVPGMHVVTGEGMRNVGFYTRLGFREVVRAPRKGGIVVMLARELDRSADGVADAAEAENGV